MRAGRKKTAPLLRQADPEYQSWTIVDRPQDRENYQDGDRSLTELWNDRPYSDVEEPHMDADPDIDAEESGEPAKRLSMEPVVRRAVMELVAEDSEEDIEKTKDLDSSGAFSGPLWGEVAPLVNAVLDLMHMNQDSDQLKSKLESSSIRKKWLIEAVAAKAEKFGFGYRTAKKDWGSFMELVPAVTGMFTDKHRRSLLRNALGEWVKETDEKIIARGFAGAPAPDDWGFGALDLSAAGGGSDTQEFYEGYVPGGIPRQETYNVDRIVNLAKGKIGEMVKGLRSRLEQRRIVDFSTAKVSTQRLQSLIRYVTDQPDSQLAMAIVVGAIVRDALRQTGEASEDIRFGENGEVDLNITPAELLSGMQGGTKRIIDEWLSMAISIMRLVGVLPGDDPDPDTEYVRADMSKYQSLHDRMRKNLAEIGLIIATSAAKGLHNNQPDEGSDEASDEASVLDKRALWKPIAALAAEMDDHGAADDLVTEFGNAIDRNIVSEAVSAAEAIHRAASSSGASAANLSAVEQLIHKLNAMSTKAASTTVADIAKRIVAPAKVRVVTRGEAEDGIELDDGETLELPGRLHDAYLVIGGPPWASR